jgi:hypothetical protein
MKEKLKNLVKKIGEPRATQILSNFADSKREFLLACAISFTIQEYDAFYNPKSLDIKKLPHAIRTVDIECRRMIFYILHTIGFSTNEIRNIFAFRLDMINHSINMIAENEYYRKEHKFKFDAIINKLEKYR